MIRAPLAACAATGPSAYQMSSQIVTPTVTPSRVNNPEATPSFIAGPGSK